MNVRAVPRGDLILAAAILVLALVEIGVNHVAYAGVAATTATVACAALVFRRFAPVVVAVVCVGAQVVNQWSGVPVSELTAPVAWITVSIYTMARQCDLRRALTGEAVAVGLFATTLLLDGTDWFWGVLVLGAPWLVGRALRASASETDALADQVSDLERRRAAEVAEALAEERTRIARDLHDVIAHSVTVMLVQAGAAQEVLSSAPDRASDSLETIQVAGRQALTDMATLVGMLREAEGDHDIGIGPQPGLDQLETLAAQSSGGGLEVTLTVAGTSAPVPPGMQVSIYRIVQESLTNVRKHSTATNARVCLTYVPEYVTVEICNDGAAAANGQGGGRGIVGMRERVEIYGGDLDAGPIVGGGYRILARYPLLGAS